MKLNEYPLIKLTLYYILGILFAKIFPLNITTLGIFFIAALILSFFFFLLRKKHIANVFVIFSVILVGYLFSLFETKSIEKNFYPFTKNFISDVQAYGKVGNIELPKKDNLTFTIYCDSVLLKKRTIKCNFNLLVKCKGKSSKIEKLASEIKPGNYVLLGGNLIKPRDKRNPGEFDYAEYLRWKNISVLFYTKTTDKVKVIDYENTNPTALIYKVRLKINNLISQIYSGNEYALIKALILGERGEIEKSIVKDFINTGTVHVLAVSGLHVGYIVMIFLLIFGRFGIFTRSLLTIFGIVFFILISGSHPSVLRAGTMAVLLIVAFISGRSYNAFNVLAFAALLILLFSPHQLFTPGFQLSFSAVFSILYFHPKFKKLLVNRNLNRYIKSILLFLLVSISAQIGTLPFTLTYFHKFSLIAIVANLFAIPIIGVIVALAIASVIFSIVSIYLASLYALTNTFIIELLIKLTHIIASVKYAYFPVYSFSFSISILYYLALFFTIYILTNFNRRAKLSALLLILINVLIYRGILNKPFFEKGKLTVIAIDIGQGDSFLLHTPDGLNYLIDAGNSTKYFDNGKHVIIPMLNYLGIDSLNAILISHVDADHYKGSLSLIKAGLTHTVFKPRLDKSIRKDMRFENFLKQNNCKIKYYQHSILENNNYRIYVLNDTTSTAYKKFDMNNRSGILKIVYGKISVLFTGDLETEGEKFYTNAYKKFLDSDILKVGHHGSKTSTSSYFLKKVSPKYAIISVGEKNKFGHPSFEVLQRLNKFGIKFKRTDKEGAVAISTDGIDIDFIDWK